MSRVESSRDKGRRKGSRGQRRVEDIQTTIHDQSKSRDRQGAHTDKSSAAEGQGESEAVTNCEDSGCRGGPDCICICTMYFRSVAGFVGLSRASYKLTNSKYDLISNNTHSGAA